MLCIHLLGLWLSPKLLLNLLFVYSFVCLLDNSLYSLPFSLCLFQMRFFCEESKVELQNSHHGAMSVKVCFFPLGILSPRPHFIKVLCSKKQLGNNIQLDVDQSKDRKINLYLNNLGYSKHFYPFFMATTHTLLKTILNCS